MTAWTLLDLCARRGLTVTREGSNLRVTGPAAARAELKDKLRSFKAEIVAILQAAEQPGARPLMPVDGPGAEWHRDALGRPCNLFGKRKGGGSALPN